MNYLQTFERFEGVKKTKKIKKHWRRDRGGVSSVMGSIANKDDSLILKTLALLQKKYLNFINLILVRRWEDSKKHLLMI
jgi:hypothetical protein